MSEARHFRWEDMPAEQLNPLIDRRLVTGERVMVAYLNLAKGSSVPLHSHDNEQVTYVLQGALQFVLGADRSRQVVVRSGEVLHIPPNLPHEAVALEDTVDVDVFSPPRQDWLDKTDDYLRGES